MSPRGVDCTETNAVEGSVACGRGSRPSVSCPPSTLSAAPSRGFILVVSSEGPPAWPSASSSTRRLARHRPHAMSLSSINILDISSKPSTPSTVTEAGPPAPSSDNATTPSASPPQTASASRRRVLPNVVLPFYSSIALFGPADKQHAATAPGTFAKPPPTLPKPFFDAHPTHKRKQRSSIINASSTAVTSSLPLRSYRRTWPSDSLSSTLNAVCSSLSPAPSVSSAASSVLCMLTFLSRTVARPYDLSLRRLSLNSSPELSALLGSHPVLPAVLAPLLFHLGWNGTATHLC